MEIFIKLKDVYGKQVAYPICEKAKTFAAIAGSKTLTGQTLRHIQALGYTLNCAPQEVILC